MKKQIAIGVDIGGSHVSCAAFDLANHRLLTSTLASNTLDNHGDSGEIIRSWGDAIQTSMDLAGAEQVAGIGFAMPGPFDYEKGIPLFTGENEKYENIYGLDVPDALKKYLQLSEDCNVRFINDATAFALGEDLLGKASKVSRSLSITLGTGFGSAFVSEGLPVLEGKDVPEYGCLWHLPFADGIADDYFSTRGFLNRYKEKTGKELAGVKELAGIAQSDETAKLLFDDFGLKLGEFLQSWITKFNIEMLVIGGNISQSYALFKDSLHEYLASQQIDMKVAISELKESASFIGSARLIDDSFYEKIAPLLKKM